MFWIIVASAAGGSVFGLVAGLLIGAAILSPLVWEQWGVWNGRR